MMMIFLIGNVWISCALPSSEEQEEQSLAVTPVNQYGTCMNIEECSICMKKKSEFELEVKLSCKHRFCSDCIFEWYELCPRDNTDDSHGECPLCRGKLQKDEVFATHLEAWKQRQLEAKRQQDLRQEEFNREMNEALRQEEVNGQPESVRNRSLAPDSRARYCCWKNN